MNGCPPLSGDPKREAADSGRGLIYQYWQSVWRWLRLGPNEVIFFEKAEDFDVVGGGSAEAAQVKNTKASVTLNSKDILLAITHFWEIREKNREFLIDYRYLTTAERGREHDKPFQNMAGLDYWDACKFDRMRLPQLRAFLLTKRHFSTSLKSFLQGATDAELHIGLVQRISWETGSRNFQELKQIITKQVICMGESRSFPPSVAALIVPQLFERVCEVISTSQIRRLDRADLITLIDQCVALTRSESGKVVESLTGPLKPNLPPSLSGQVKTTIPFLLEGASQRKSVVSKLCRALGDERFLLLTGSTGMGKSTLARLVTTALALPVRWFDLRGLKAEDVRTLLNDQTFRFDGVGANVVHVLDDLEFNPMLENSLVEFAYAVLSQSGSLIITSQSNCPPDVINRLNLNIGVERAVPVLSDEELTELLTNYGCSRDSIPLWCQIVYSQTLGHPQLALAMIKGLKTRGWPEFGKQRTLIPDDLASVRANARKSLRENLPSESARLLAFKLSLIEGVFRRDHAIAIATTDPAIVLPGEAFDILNGPWVEQIDSVYFRISPLLKGAAFEILDKATVSELHKTIAYALMNSGELTYLEASEVLRHALAVRYLAPLHAITTFFVSIPIKSLPNVSRYFAWFVGEKLGPNETLVADNEMLDCYLRMGQFMVASQLSPNRLAPLVVDAWEHSLAHLKDHAMANLMRASFLSQIISNVSVPLPIKRAVEMLLELLDLMSTVEARPFFPSDVSFLGDEHLEKHEAFFTFVLARCNDVKDTHDLFEAIGTCEERKRSRLLSIFSKHERWASLVTGKIFLAEETKKEPNWKYCISSLESFAKTADAWSQPVLTAHCYASIAVIYDEYLHDPDAAEGAIAVGQRMVGDENPVLRNAHAMVLYRKEDFAGALRILKTILSVWNSRNVSLVFSCHKAVVCAGKIDDWQSMLAFAETGAKEAANQGLDTMALGFKADRAWALWKLGRCPESVQAFSVVLAGLPDSTDPDKNFREFALFKQVGHGLAWLMEQTLGQPFRLREPPPGWFSVSEIDKEVKAQPNKNVASLW